MNFLTAKELARVNARNTYSARKLTPLELVIKHIVFVSGMEYGNQAQKQQKDSEVELTIKALQEYTPSDTLLSKARLAMHNKDSLEELLTMYPYVQFEDILNGTYKFSSIEQFAINGYKSTHLQALLHGVITLQEIVATLPKGGEFYLSSPATNYKAMFYAYSKSKMRKYQGLTIPKVTQEGINFLISRWSELFYAGCEVVDLPNIWKRARLVEEGKWFEERGIKVNFTKHFLNNEFGVPVMEFVEESTDTKYYICL